MSPVERAYDYRPPLKLIVYSTLFFGTASVFLVYKALTNREGLILNGNALSRVGATNFYWAVAALCLGFLGLAAVHAYRRMAFKHRIAFTPTALLAPRSLWSSAEMAVEYRSITHLELTRLHGNFFLAVTHTGGKLTIRGSLLGTLEAIAEVHDLLAQRIAYGPIPAVGAAVHDGMARS